MNVKFGYVQDLERVPDARDTKEFRKEGVGIGVKPTEMQQG